MVMVRFSGESCNLSKLMFISKAKVHYDHFTNFCKIDIGNIIAGWIPTKWVRNTGKYKKNINMQIFRLNEKCFGKTHLTRYFYEGR